MDEDKRILICPDCGGNVSSRVNCCPHCGCPIDFVISSNNANTVKEDTPNGFLDSAIKVNADDEDYFGGFNPFAFMFPGKMGAFLIYSNGNGNSYGHHYSFPERELYCYSFNDKSFEQLSPDDIDVLSACNNDSYLYYVGLDRETHTKLSVFEVGAERILEQTCVYTMTVQNADRALICEQNNLLFLFVSYYDENDQNTQFLYKIEKDPAMVLCSKIGKTKEFVVGVAKGQDNCIFLATATEHCREYFLEYNLHYFKWNPARNSQMNLRKAVKENDIISCYEFDMRQGFDEEYSFSKNFRVENKVGEIEYGYEYGESDIPNGGISIFNRTDNSVVFQHKCFQRMNRCDINTCVIDGFIFMRKEDHEFYSNKEFSVEEVLQNPGWFLYDWDEWDEESKICFDDLSEYDDVNCDLKKLRIGNCISCFDLRDNFKRTRIAVGNIAFKEYEIELNKNKMIKAEEEEKRRQEQLEKERYKRWISKKEAENPEWNRLTRELEQYRHCKIVIPSYNEAGEILWFERERIHLLCGEKERCFLSSAVGTTIFVENDNDGKKIKQLTKILKELPNINQFLPIPDNF